MRLAKMVLAGSMLTVISSVTWNSAIWAQQPLTGIVTTIDRIRGTIAIREIPSGTAGANSGTVGANSAGTAELYKVQDGNLLTPVHAGDRVSFSVSESGGAKALTKLEKQKP
jgi:hypothetical protein